MTYVFIKWLHPLGASVLLLTVIADFMFTATAAVVQPLTGFLLWRAGSARLDAWLVAVLSLYAFVGLCWLPVVVMQMRLRDRAVAAGSIAELGDDFHARFRRWFRLGWPAFMGVLLLFALMLLRGLFT